jgi:hypothetical protein
MLKAKGMFLKYNTIQKLAEAFVQSGFSVRELTYVLYIIW